MHPDSERVARHLCEQSKSAQVGGELFDTAAISKALNMSQQDLDMAVDELQQEGLLRHRGSGIGAGTVMAEPELFRRMDPEVKGWDAEEDALAVAREIVKVQGGSQTSDVAKALGWDPRRMNPACEELAARDKVKVRKFMGSSPFTYGHLMPTDATRRLARDGW